MPMSVERYKERFLKESKFRAMKEGYVVRVSPFVRRIISEIVSQSGIPGMNMSIFVDNVLKEHIREYRPELERLIESGRQRINFNTAEP